MAREVADILQIEINAPSEGHKRLRTVMEISINDTDPNAETVKTINPERKAIAHKSGISDIEVELQVKRLFPDPEVDWFRLKKLREIFTIYYIEAAGLTEAARYVLEDCKVTEVSGTSNSEGEADMTVKIIAIDHRREG